MRTSSFSSTSRSGFSGPDGLSFPHSSNTAAARGGSRRLRHGRTAMIDMRLRRATLCLLPPRRLTMVRRPSRWSHEGRGRKVHRCCALRDSRRLQHGCERSDDRRAPAAATTPAATAHRSPAADLSRRPAGRRAWEPLAGEGMASLGAHRNADYQPSRTAQGKPTRSSYWLKPPTMGRGAAGPAEFR